MSGFPSWKPQAEAGPPLPFLSLSLKHVPSKSPSLQTPPVEPSPDLLPRRPTFLRLATLKGPAQARTQTRLHVFLLCTFRRPETHKDTVGHSSHLCTQEVAHGAHLTRAHRQVQTQPCTPRFLPPAYHRLRSMQLPARGAHTHTDTVTHRPCHAEKQVQTHSILSPCTAQPPLPLPPPYAGAAQGHNACAACSLVHTAKHI